MDGVEIGHVKAIPFSRIMALVIFVTLPYVGFYLGYLYGQNVVPNMIFNPVVKFPEKIKLSPAVSQSYTACGCGCCGGTKPQEKCLYHSKGDNMDEIIQADKKLQSSSSCAAMGCSLGLKYRYCD
jgi:hypothetical protein